MPRVLIHGTELELAKLGTKKPGGVASDTILSIGWQHKAIVPNSCSAVTADRRSLPSGFPQHHEE